MRGHFPAIAASALALASSSAWTPRARAEAPTDAQVQAARELFVAAEKDEDAARWADALDKLRRVAQVRLTAGVRYHEALCEENLGQLLAALGDYTLAQGQARRENAQDVSALVGPRLSKLNARVPRLTLHVDGPQPDLEVRLDGGAVVKAMWGIAMPLDPGAHKIEATASGYAPFSRTVTLAERDNTLVDVRVSTVAAPPPPEPSTPAPSASSPTPAPAPSPPPVSPPPEAASPEPPARNHTGAIVATVGAVALAGGGVAAYFIAGNKHDSAVTTCAGSVTPCDDLKHGVQLWDALALGGWIGAAALATVAVIAWSSPARAPSLGATSGQIFIGPGSVGVRGSF